jgi:hypothetical protein
MGISAGFAPFRMRLTKVARAAPAVVQVRGIRHEASRIDEVPERIHRRQPTGGCQIDNLLPLTEYAAAADHQKRTCTSGGGHLNARSTLAASHHLERHDLPASFASRRLRPHATMSACRFPEGGNGCCRASSFRISSRFAVVSTC